MNKPTPAAIPVIYLAAPFDAQDVTRRLEIAAIVSRVCAHLMARNHAVVAPTLYFHDLCRHYGLPTDTPTFEVLERALLPKCKELWVLKLSGWEADPHTKWLMREAGKQLIPVREYTVSELLSEYIPDRRAAPKPVEIADAKAEPKSPDLKPTVKPAPEK